MCGVWVACVLCQLAVHLLKRWSVVSGSCWHIGHSSWNFAPSGSEWWMSFQVKEVMCGLVFWCLMMGRRVW